MLRSIVAVLSAAVLTTALLRAQTTQPADGDKTVTSSGLTITRTKAPEGARNGDIVFVHCSGRLETGAQFYSSYERGEPIAIQLGSGQVIAGWEEGLLGMQVGEKRQLIVPAKLAYGEEGRPPKIPPNSTLVFDLELVGLQRK